MSKLTKKSRPAGRVLQALLLALSLLLHASFRPPQPRKSVIARVVIDAGHGGHDSGCLGPHKVKEKDVALAIALKLGKYIEDNYPDVKVIYTRETDVFIELHQRAQIANDAHADLFISIHCNSACYFDKKKKKELCNGETHGTESWVMGLHKTDANLEVAKRENSVMLLEKDYVKQYDGFDPNSPEADIIFSLYQNTFMDQSLRLATLVQQELSNKGRQSRGVKQAGFWVLYKTTMPSILIETGFLSSPEEEKFLGSPRGQQDIATAVFRAFRQYKGSLESGAVKPDKLPQVVFQDTQETPKGKQPDTGKASDPIVPTKSDSMEVPVVPVPAPDVSGGDDIHFSIQIISSVEKLQKNNPRFKGLKDINEEKKDNVYKYSAGNYKSMEEAVAAQSRMREMGFKDAFVIAFRNDIRIPVPEAREALRKANSK